MVAKKGKFILKISVGINRLLNGSETLYPATNTKLLDDRNDGKLSLLKGNIFLFADRLTLTVFENYRTFQNIPTFVFRDFKTFRSKYSDSQ
jgi:hypothetical protein